MVIIKNDLEHILSKSQEYQIFWFIYETRHLILLTHVTGFPCDNMGLDRCDCEVVRPEVLELPLPFFNKDLESLCA